MYQIYLTEHNNGVRSRTLLASFKHIRAAKQFAISTAKKRSLPIDSCHGYLCLDKSWMTGFYIESNFNF